MVETVACVHCGAAAKHPVTKVIQGQLLSFCCNGCLEVYEMMLEEGLVEPAVHPAQSKGGDAAAPLKGTASSRTVAFHVDGMTCSNCAASVDRQLRSVPGVLDVQVSLEKASAAVQLEPGGASMAELRRAVQKAGYSVPAGEGDA
jgi:Cu+-exporting ATPase